MFEDMAADGGRAEGGEVRVEAHKGHGSARSTAEIEGMMVREHGA